ncbi:hypothetical protein BG74_01700 [Sodalis-like endosymbiont of Proechinophthirus fluctus]|nr:hypothetical protein BG74_01700 [Sodalis-like endosymbiont of Proechinophthirus fluctus]
MSLQDDNLPLANLLAAISCFSLQASACNQFLTPLINRHLQPLQQVTVALARELALLASERRTDYRQPILLWNK